MKRSYSVASVTVAILTLLGGNAVCASGMELDKTVYLYGETIKLTYDRADTWEKNLFYKRSGDGPNGGGGFLLTFPAESGVISIDTRRLVNDIPGYGFGGDHTRNLISFRLTGFDQRSREFVKQTEYFWVLRPLDPMPNGLAFGSNRIHQGQAVDLGIPGLDQLLELSSDNFGNDQPAISFVRLGQSLPGGAAIPDEQIARLLIDLGSDSNRIRVVEAHEVGSISPDEGHYEIRLLGATDAVVTRLPLTIAPPDLAGRISLDPPRQDSYPADNPPAVRLTAESELLEQEFGGEAELALYRMFDTEIGDEIDSTMKRYLREDLQAGGPVLGIAQGSVRPGRHELWLTVPMNFDRRFLLDRLGFDVGGRSPYPPPKTQEPPLDRNDVRLTVQPDRQVEVGQTLRLTVDLPPGIDPSARRMWATVRRRYTPGFQCLGVIDRRDSHGAWHNDPLPVPTDGILEIAAPAVPERWEFMVWEPDEWGGPTLLGRIAFDTVLSPMPGAISLTRPPRLGEPITVSYQISEGYPYQRYDLQLFRSAEQPPGAPIPARIHDSVLISEPTGEVTFDRLLWSGGPYEVRLTVAPGQRLKGIIAGGHEIKPFVLDRVMFDLDDPRAPPLPAAYAYARAPELDDVPQPDDPLRGLSVWWPSPNDCEPPRVAKIARIVFASKERNHYVPYEERGAIPPDHPFYLLVEYEEEPTFEEKSVTLRAGDSVRDVLVRKIFGNGRLFVSSSLFLRELTECAANNSSCPQ